MTVGNCAAAIRGTYTRSGSPFSVSGELGTLLSAAPRMERSDICNMAVPLKTHRHENTHRHGRQGVIARRETERYSKCCSIARSAISATASGPWPPREMVADHQGRQHQSRGGALSFFVSA
jgi:hypothetical protein